MLGVLCVWEEVSLIVRGLTAPPSHLPLHQQRPRPAFLPLWPSLAPCYPPGRPPATSISFLFNSHTLSKRSHL